MNKIVPVILCGGSGTRLWPLSRESHPKQFVDLGEGRTLFKDTLRRAAGLDGAQRPVIVCNEKYRFYARNEMRECGVEGEVILEPAPRNTAPAIALAAFGILEACGAEKPLMLVMPSDHRLEDSGAFVSAVLQSKKLAEDGMIVTYGIVPDAPSTGFGYIRAGEALGENGFRVAAFVEKPDRAKAEKMLAEGGCFWNSGIFLVRPDVYLEELGRFSPRMREMCAQAWQKRVPDNGFVRPGKKEFLSCPEDSIDYAVMERTQCAAMTPMRARWNDMGSWDSFFQDAPKDEAGNACKGDVMLEGVRNSYIHSRGRLVAAIGVEDLTVIETQDAVLVAKSGAAQSVKKIVGKLKESGRYQYEHHPLVFRPWGSYETIALGDRFQVKRIIVNPGEVLSLQLHHHRAEHWVVVSGTAEITLNGQTTLYTENQSTYIPIGCEHRLRNPGLIPLVLIEIQSGAYLGEDDIVRLEDVYGRDKTS